MKFPKLPQPARFQDNAQPETSHAESSNRMNNRLETLPRATVVIRKQEARQPCGLLDLVARRMIHEVPGKPPATLGRG